MIGNINDGYKRWDCCRYMVTVGFMLLSASLALSGCRSSEPKDKEPLPVKDFVFEQSDQFAQAHASTIARAEDGVFVVAWFGGTHEKHDDVGIWISRGMPGNWSPPRELAKVREDPHWNPVLFSAPDGDMMLFFKVGEEIPDWETWVTSSPNGGATWSEPRELVPGDRGGRGPVKNKPIVLSNGDWLAPASHEDERWKVFVDRSRDGGQSWKASDYVPIDTSRFEGKGAIQPTLWESEPGKVHMLVRTSDGVIGRSDSDDYGKTWSPLYKTSLPNPNSGIDLARLADGTLILAYNPDDENWGARAPLRLALSEDNGKTWDYTYDVETGTDEDEFSYPSIISWGDTAAVVYTWQRERVAFWSGTARQLRKLATED
ncbi:sialidase family protein [Fodinibius sediminis]|uniref:Predicted neuraminidase (Sialidase) n=1 Tax=Fodinibius sediminis TaxID=1214077 RepID=A0A521BTU4_9BACT|nr:sialidase family protein [Fodinibius sediminis]SMO50579.1 Predicted neuraminidase (sialidase) [Fodinibius sediminis]